ncbi:MAG: hypothetical protein EXQ74_04395 [Thermoleophilia bacterium]|nr:hypothetical protein [Thermoleophilia bacterium]
MTDHLSGGLRALAPIALDGLTEALVRWEGSSLTELRDASDAIHTEVRRWAADSANASRPIAACPVHLDRIAVGVLLERRFFTE